MLIVWTVYTIIAIPAPGENRLRIARVRTVHCIQLGQPPLTNKKPAQVNRAGLFVRLIVDDITLSLFICNGFLNRKVIK